MSTYLLTSREEVEEHRQRINTIRSAIEYDVVNSPINTEFEELEVLLHDAVVKLDEIYDKIKEHVYVFDVTVTVSRRVNVKASGEWVDECDAEQAAIDYAISELDCPIDWNEDDVHAFRDEDEETTSVYDVEV